MQSANVCGLVNLEKKYFVVEYCAVEYFVYKDLRQAEKLVVAITNGSSVRKHFIELRHKYRVESEKYPRKRQILGLNQQISFDYSESNESK